MSARAERRRLLRQVGAHRAEGKKGRRGRVRAQATTYNPVEALIARGFVTTPAEIAAAIRNEDDDTIARYLGRLP